MADDKFDSNFTDEDLKEEAITNRENFESIVDTNIWGYSSSGLEAKKAAMTMLATKTGMYARVPLVCKGDACPYRDRCPLLSYNLAPQGQPCAIETANIEMSYEGYMKDFADENGELSFTDKRLISEIINYDILIDRCKALLADHQTPIEQVFAGVSEQGEEFTKPEIDKALEALERTTKKRNETYSLMLATRKDKKSDKDCGSGKSTSQLINDVLNTSFTIEQKPVVDVDTNEGGEK